MVDRDLEILDIHVKTSKDEIQKLNLANDLKINIANINTEFCEQPAIYAYWATLAAQAKTIYESVKLRVTEKEDYIKKSLVGELDVEVRMHLESNGERITESKVANAIYVHPKYLEEQAQLYKLKQELQQAQAQLTTLEIAKESMNQRKDMLISLGAQLRQEYGNTDITLKEKANKVVSISRN